jgi:hypothetical protein
MVMVRLWVSDDNECPTVTFYWIGGMENLMLETIRPMDRCDDVTFKFEQLQAPNYIVRTWDSFT